MDFVDQINQFSKNVLKIKDKLQTEEATKTSLIMPFFSILGYDVFNPDEFVPEYIADVGIKKNEKVDYAIILNGVPMILIEAKACNEPLDKHGSQLFRYFSTTKSKFAILSNGIIYQFFTDLDEPNKMDAKPFLTIDLLNINDAHINALKAFTKSKFCCDSILDTAFEFKYLNEFKSIFKDQLKSPNEAFVRFFLDNSYNGLKTKKVIDTFTPILKKALNDFISESMTEKIKTILSKESNKETDEIIEQEDEQVTSKIVTTPEELEAFFIIKNILNDCVPMEYITYKDTTNYINILYKGNVRHWICRLKINTKNKTLIIPDENKNTISYNLNDVYDIKQYGKELHASLNKYTELSIRDEITK